MILVPGRESLMKAEQNEDERKGDARIRNLQGAQDDGEDEYDLDKLFKDSIKKKKRPTIMVKIKIEIQKSGADNAPAEVRIRI
nr:CMF_HP1_G0048380.mRNA.1.CDS.1 [Saccharomyces cerevisiae]